MVEDVSPLPVIQPVRLGKNYSVAAEFHHPEELVTDFQPLPNPIPGCKWWGQQQWLKVPSPRQMELFAFSILITPFRSSGAQRSMINLAHWLFSAH